MIWAFLALLMAGFNMIGREMPKPPAKEQPEAQQPPAVEPEETQRAE